LTSQGTPQPPQLFGSVAVFTHVPPPQSILPRGQRHTPPEQTCVAGQAVQLGPQCVASVFVLYAQGVPLPQSLYPSLHLVPHDPVLQVAVPLIGTLQAVHAKPQCVGSLLAS
jgi:hypothetical protein